MDTNGILSREEISSFVNAETMENFADSLINGNCWLNDFNELVMELPMPRPLYKLNLSNNYEEFAKQFSMKVGQILKQHKLEAEK